MLEEVEAEVSNAKEALVFEWRLETLLRAGFAGDAAHSLAACSHVDLHVAVGLVKRGCPPETALRILL